MANGLFGMAEQFGPFGVMWNRGGGKTAVHETAKVKYKEMRSNVVWGRGPEYWQQILTKHF